MPSFNEIVEIDASPEFVWERLTDTKNPDMTFCSGVYVEYDSPGVELFEGQIMRVELQRLGKMIVASCESVDHSSYFVEYEILQAPYVKTGNFGFDVSEKNETTRLEIFGDIRCSNFAARAGLSTILPMIAPRMQKAGEHLTRLAA